MPKASAGRPPETLSQARARAIWIAAQRLDEREPFGEGPEAVAKAVAHLGYVQIDTINVIERCHHHILFNRIPAYRRADLNAAQADDKSVFEYWTHALSYIATEDFPYFVAAMKEKRKDPGGWFGSVEPQDMRRILKRVREDGPLAISDIKDDKLVDKSHAWGSRKPSKKALQAGFFGGQLAISKRDGMLKTYDLLERHFGWERLPKPATRLQTLKYLLERALRSQGLVSLDSICHLNAKDKPDILAIIEREVRAKRLRPVLIEGCDVQHWGRPETLDSVPPEPTLTHILSPFDPLIIQRKRTSAFFGYDHIFEVYIPKEKRKLGYFTLPVLIGDEVVAGIDLKADRQDQRLLIQAWHWMGKGNEADHKAIIEEELGRFSEFQFGN